MNHLAGRKLLVEMSLFFIVVLRIAPDVANHFAISPGAYSLVTMDSNGFRCTMGPSETYDIPNFIFKFSAEIFVDTLFDTLLLYETHSLLSNQHNHTNPSELLIEFEIF